MKKIIYILVLAFTFSCVAAQAQSFRTHKVKDGETVASIAKQYDILESTIYTLNPDAREKLKPEAVLIIPGLKNTNESETVTTKEITGFQKHKVKRKETLYSLSQKYNITQDEIKKHNKFLYANNLRKGDKLQIPIFETVIKVKEATSLYTVKPKEGKWRIAYKFGVTVQELEALNPDLGPVIQPGQVIRVPNVETETIKTVDDTYSYYTVLPKEGFYRIKLKTGVEKEVLENLNPNLVETGLKVGMVLKLPYNSKLAEVTTAESTGTLEIVRDTVNTGAIKLSSLVLDKEMKRIAIMLPFKLNKMNVDSVYDTKQFIKKDRTLRVSLDFYSGVLMALDSLEALGVNLKVDVYDTKNMHSEVAAILRNNNFNKTNAVIGPLVGKHFNTVASTLENNNISMVSPIVKSVTPRNNVFQSRPSDEALKSKIINYFKADTTAHVLVVTDYKNKEASTILKGQFKNASLVTSRTNKKTKKDAYYVFEQDLKKMLKTGNNVVFLQTQDDGFVSNVSSILNSLNTDKIKITLATTLKNKAFDDDDVQSDHLSNLNFTFPSVSKMIDEEDNNAFVKRYELDYNITPNAYAVRGFDVTMDVVLRIVTSGTLEQSVIDSPLTRYVENKFSYKNRTDGGYYNDTVYLVQYKDLKMVEVK